jgi:truncated hemoglobin YjbI
MTSVWNRDCIVISFVVAALLVVAGCGSNDEKNKNKDFFTSGDREADQRAEQRMAKTQQERGETQKGSDDKGDTKRPLFERLGGESGLNVIADDFLPRVLADPRVNWERKGVTRGGFSLERGKSVTWDASPANVEQLKKHLVQFLAVATGGPPKYDGLDMSQAHQGLHISNAEFDATIGDLKASLDKLGVKTDEQKELLSIIESTRNQVVTER